MKCDLHVHTVHSGMCTLPWLHRVARESYNQPEELYQLLKRRGMDLVTVTDHDSVDAAEALRRHPDFFLSEEVTCQTPSGNSIHVGVYDISERDHIEIQRRRNDLEALAAYLGQRGLLFSIHHPFSAVTGRREAEDFDLAEALFPAVETRNGQMLECSNHSSEDWARRTGKIGVAGSDGHTLAAPGKTYTEVSGARSKEEFLQGLRAGRGLAAGEMGSCWKLMQEIAGIGGGVLRENPALLPLVAFVPLFVLGNALPEMLFAYRWSRRLRAGSRIGGEIACPPTPDRLWEPAQ